MTLQEFKECQIEADKRMKASNGHRFVTILKTRCDYCGRKPGAKGTCKHWFQTFLIYLGEVMMERKFIG